MRSMRRKWCWWQPVILLLGLVPALVRAKGPGVNRPATPLLAVPAADVSAGTPGEPGGLAILLFFAVTTLVLLAIIAVNHLRKRREEEAILLQARISNALLETPGLVRSLATPTVHLPFWSGAPARIELSGEVASSHLEQVALRVTAQVASRIRPHFSIENRMAVVPPSGVRAAGAGSPERPAFAGAKAERTWLAAASHLRS